MILPNYNENDIVKEYFIDMQNVMRYSDYMDKKFRKMVMRAALFPVRYSVIYTSPMKNKWIIILEAHNKKEVGDYCRMVTVCTYRDRNGFLNAAMSSSMNNKQMTMFYPWHFFKRYKDRSQKEQSGDEIMREFFRYNYSYVFDIEQKRVLNSNLCMTEVYGSTKEGIALGIMTENNNFLFKTFITYEMTKGEQIKKFADNEKIRKEIHDKI